MSGEQPTWIEQHCARLIPIEKQTVAALGKETAGFFLSAANDCLTVIGAVGKAYPGERSRNLVFVTLWGLFKEAYWFHSFFVAGNYPRLLGRLRFIWESVFRAGTPW
jgi:hypothetical protein